MVARLTTTRWSYAFASGMVLATVRGSDLLALVKFGRLKVEGDMHAFMANLFYFKGVLASVRLRA